MAMNGVIPNGSPRCDESSLVLVNSSDVGSPSMKSKSVHQAGDNSDGWPLPFVPLAGEKVEHICHSKENTIVQTNFRLLVCCQDTFYNVPIQLIEYVEMRDLLDLLVNCKDTRTFRIMFDAPESCTKWWHLITTATATPSSIEDLFAFRHYQYLIKQGKSPLSPLEIEMGEPYSFLTELRRMEFDTRSVWRISEINTKFEVCQSYPKLHVVPAWTSDKDVRASAAFRSMGRFPSLVWRNKDNGAVLVRCSQPEVGLLGWRCNEDEKLLSSIAKSAHMNSWRGLLSEPSNKPKPLLIVDARSYTAAFANRAKGGGCEYQEYYPDCQVQFMSLANIHGIRKSFQSLRTLCQLGQDQSNWLSALEATRWLQYLSVLIRSTLVIVEAIDKEEQSVLVHCSDGWDRTAQLVALAELILDPYYRTIQVGVAARAGMHVARVAQLLWGKRQLIWAVSILILGILGHEDFKPNILCHQVQFGFQVLVEREWIEFGHKFGDRCGHSTERDVNERCPVFLQWLDCVYQLLKQFPTAFEFNEQFLVKLVLHTYSCLYGNFLCNNMREKQNFKVKYRTESIWSLLKPSRREIRNFLYSPLKKVLYPQWQVRYLHLWDAVYMSKDPQLTEIATELEENSSVFQDSGNFTAESVSTGISHTSTQKDPNKDLTSNDNNDIQKPRNRSAPLLTSSGSSQGGSADSGNLNGDSSVDNGITTVCENGNNLTSEKELEPSVDGKANLGRKTNSINGVVMPDKEDDEEELKSGLNGADLSSEELNDMSTSMSSSVKTLTGEDSVDPIELNDCLNHIKTEDGSTSEPTTPTSAKVKGHRRTLSSDGSPSKRLIKSKSFNEGMSSSAHSGNTRMDRKHSNGCDTLRVIGQYLDIDGLTKSLDVFQNRILQLDLEHRAQVSKLHKQLDAERQARIALLQREQDPDCESPGRFSDLQDDVLSLPDSVNGERASVSSISNEESWEKVQFDDVQPTRWIPDHIATQCASCDATFCMVVRKHHCRKCGRVFCGTCSDKSLPVPEEQLYEPVRVCIKCYETYGQLDNQIPINSTC